MLHCEDPLFLTLPQSDILAVSQNAQPANLLRCFCSGPQIGLIKWTLHRWRQRNYSRSFTAKVCWSSILLFVNFLCSYVLKRAKLSLGFREIKQSVQESRAKDDRRVNWVCHDVCKDCLTTFQKVAGGANATYFSDIISKYYPRLI